MSEKQSILKEKPFKKPGDLLLGSLKGKYLKNEGWIKTLDSAVLLITVAQYKI